jgi:hypothetical protein
LFCLLANLPSASAKVDGDITLLKTIADSHEKKLGAAFGEFLVEQKEFRWVVVTDEYGTEYAVRCNIGEVTAFPRASIEKRIEDGCPELFQNIYLMTLDQLKRCEEVESDLDPD